MQPLVIGRHELVELGWPLATSRVGRRHVGSVVRQAQKVRHSIHPIVVKWWVRDNQYLFGRHDLSQLCQTLQRDVLHQCGSVLLQLLTQQIQANGFIAVAPKVSYQTSDRIVPQDNHSQ